MRHHPRLNFLRSVRIYGESKLLTEEGECAYYCTIDINPYIKLDVVNVLALKLIEDVLNLSTI